MKKRILSAILCIIMVVSIMPISVFASDVISIVYVNVEEPKTGEQPDYDAYTGSNPSIIPGSTVKKVSWKGEFADDGSFLGGEKYTLEVTVKIRDGSPKTFSTRISTNGDATINGKQSKVISWNPWQIVLSKDYETKKPAEPVIKQPVGNYISSAKAQEQSTEKGGTATINCDDDWSKLGDDNKLANYTRLVLNNPNGELDLNRFTHYIGHFYHMKEIWFAPGYQDISDYTSAIYTKGMHNYFNNSGYMDSSECFVVISDTAPSSNYEDWDANHGIKLYSGDLNTAVSKGISATKNICTNHKYTAFIQTADRASNYVSCTEPTRYYYSCENCGQCEYNKNHTIVGRDIKVSTPFHDMGAILMTNAAYIGVNAEGKHVYWESCYGCGKSEEQIAIDEAHESYKGLGDTEITYSMWLDNQKQAYAYREKNALLAGGNTAQMFIANNAPVSAKLSTWAQNDVNWANEKGLVDKALLGNDYTRAMTRLEFCSVAVKMAERMSGKTITPAPSSTFTDTTNEYVLKAYAAGITSGTGNGAFSPNATLNREQMATFVYRALQYVKDNSTVRYTDYTSKLGSFSDSSKIDSWAKDPMAFMNALNLIKGTSNTTISPTGTCTIEQALAVAYRSLDADKIGWYLVRTDKPLYDTWGLGLVYFRKHQQGTVATYVPGEKYWVSGLRLHEHFPRLEFVEPYTGDTVVSYEENFIAIRD